MKLNMADYVTDSLRDYGTYYNEERAIASIVDGLKPVQRKLLWAAYQLKLKSTGRFSKVVPVIGEAMKFYQHGESSLKSAIIRMGQPHKCTYPLVQGSGNWGSQSGLAAPDSGAAAPRYIEVRLSEIGERLLASVKNGTAVMGRNFDGTMDEPELLFASIPTFLLLHQKGIGVGTASTIPSFKLDSVIAATERLIKTPEVVDLEVAKMLVPYFAQNATIINRQELPFIFTHKPRDGKPASIRFRATFSLAGNVLTITNFPYSASPELVAEQITKAVPKVPILSNIIQAQDTSSLNADDSERVSMTLTLRAKVDHEELIRALCENTSLQSHLSCNVVLTNKEGHAQEFSVISALRYWIEIFKEKGTLELENKIAELETEAHLSEGLIKALGIIDRVIEIIKASESKAAASKNLVAEGFSLAQAVKILDLKLHRLTALERESLEKELAELKQEISELKTILSSESLFAEFLTKKLNAAKALELYKAQGKIEDSLYAKKVKLDLEEVSYATLKSGSVKFAEKMSGTAKPVSKKTPLYAFVGNTVTPITGEVFLTKVDLLLTAAELNAGYVLSVDEDGKTKITSGDLLTPTRKITFTKQSKPKNFFITELKDAFVTVESATFKKSVSLEDIKPSGRGTMGKDVFKLGELVLKCELKKDESCVGKKKKK